MSIQESALLTIIEQQRRKIECLEAEVEILTRNRNDWKAFAKELCEDIANLASRFKD